MGVSIYFAIQSYTFQTWLGEKAGTYLSKELNNTITINKISLDFFKKANLEGVFISDKKADTLFTGDLLVDIKDLDYKHQKIEFKRITIKNSTAKLLNYKSDSLLNFQFLIDYFDSGTTDTSTKPKWDVKLGDIYLDNVNFTYRNENSDLKISKNMNFNNLLFTKTSGKLSNIKFNQDTIYVKLNDFRTIEQCGFVLRNLTTEAKISSSELLLNKLIIIPSSFL